jgi:glycogen operon protein
MLLGGDEIVRTQRGNNNAYCQDNEISWFDWSKLDEPNYNETKRMVDFVSKLIETRRRHPTLKSERFLHGDKEILPGIMDVSWFDFRGAALSPETWADLSSHALCLRRAAMVGDKVDVTLLMLNASQQDREFIYPEPSLNWSLLVDSTNPNAESVPANMQRWSVPAHGAVLLGAMVMR